MNHCHSFQYQQQLNYDHLQTGDLQNSKNDLNLVPVSEVLPAVQYQSVFGAFPFFNIMQSSVFEDAFYTDKPLVVCSPTGSGKTVVFELCIVRLLMTISEMNAHQSKFKIVYMAPVKSLCNERFIDWKNKFEPLGVFCILLTGDSENEDYFELQKYSLIITTPEKWDSVTRLWKNNKSLVQMVKLLLVDEIHLLNEEERGATMEATLSRMKTIQNVLSCDSNQSAYEPAFRFVALSATFPNVEDAANWLSSPKTKGIFYRFHDSIRPVALNKVVLGYPFSSASEFKFDLMLSYKLNHVIQSYSERKPTLVFCSTRKGVIHTAVTLSKTAKFVANQSHKMHLIDVANRIHDSTLRECILNGIGFHHGGLEVSDRRLLENLFSSSQLLVLISTSTLAMGVNFPAHLVIIKSTSQYIAGCYKEYNDIQILQMIGRAGRPQFDRTATAVIMTKSNLQKKYESLITGTQLIESNLHKHMVEHLNAEIVLGAIVDISIAMEWLQSTFLYQRVFKNPTYYGMSADLSNDKIEKKLRDVCIKELNGLKKHDLIYMDSDSFQLQPTRSGRLMAKYYIAYETMIQFSALSGNENLAEMITAISSCKELDDIQLRVNEKKILNELNKSKISSIRFPLQGKIKTKQMKINCLIQATLGCLSINESSLNQDAARIFRVAQRVSRCLIEYLSANKKAFSGLRNAVILSKCFKAKLWENSKHVSRQLEKIGNAFSTLLVNAGIISFDKLLETNPRDIELILKRSPPFGNTILDSVHKIPKYSLQVEECPPSSRHSTNIFIRVALDNMNEVLNNADVSKIGCHLLIGDSDNNTLVFNKIMNTTFLKKQYWCQRVNITRAKRGDDINIDIISDTFVGMDIKQTYSLIYDGESSVAPTKLPIRESVEKYITDSNMKPSNNRNCNHKCLRKNLCSHSCCKTGIKICTPKKSRMSKFMEQLQNKNSQTQKKVKIGAGTFTQNVKMFETNKNSDIFTYNQLILKNWEKQQNDQLLQQDTCSNSTKHFTQSTEEGIIDKPDNQEELELHDENDLHTLSFDINFNDCSFQEKVLNIPDNNQKQDEVPKKVPRFSIFHEDIIKQSYPRKIVKWNDPVAAEETFNVCLNFLTKGFKQ